MQHNAEKYTRVHPGPSCLHMRVRHVMYTLLASGDQHSRHEPAVTTVSNAKHQKGTGAEQWKGNRCFPSRDHQTYGLQVQRSMSRCARCSSLLAQQCVVRDTARHQMVSSEVPSDIGRIKRLWACRHVFTLSLTFPPETLRSPCLPPLLCRGEVTIARVGSRSPPASSCFSCPRNRRNLALCCLLPISKRSQKIKSRG
jgi:hypothetical protein